MDGHKVDLTPSPEAYVRMLKLISMESTQSSHRKWAKNQLKALGVVEE